MCYYVHVLESFKDVGVGGTFLVCISTFLNQDPLCTSHVRRRFLVKIFWPLVLSLSARPDLNDTAVFIIMQA